jgi:hypothetical protein
VIEVVIATDPPSPPMVSVTILASLRRLVGASPPLPFPRSTQPLRGRCRPPEATVVGPCLHHLHVVPPLDEPHFPTLLYDAFAPRSQPRTTATPTCVVTMAGLAAPHQWAAEGHFGSEARLGG